jgi:drug/metabolite transporter (DMT)-like permease
VSKRRAWLVWSLVVIATIVLILSSLTIWTKRQLLSTENWTNSSGRLLENDQIRGALSTKLVDLAFERTDVAAQLKEALPPRAQAVAPAIAAGLQTAAIRAADELLTRPKVQQLWVSANRAAHERLVAILEKKKTGRLITADTGQLTLDLRPLIDQLDGRLGLKNRIGSGASGQTGVIVLLQSKQLKTAQNAVTLINHLSVWLALAAFALYALAIYLARGKQRRMLMVTGFSLIVVGLIIVIVRRFVGNSVVDSLVKVQANRPAVRALWSIETDQLRDIALALLLYGCAFVGAAFLGGPSRMATAVRRRMAPAFREHLFGVYAVASLVFLLFIAWGPTVASRRLWGVAVLAGLTVLGIELWRRQTLREFPEPAAAVAAAQPAASAGPAEAPPGPSAVPD